MSAQRLFMNAAGYSAPLVLNAPKPWASTPGQQNYIAGLVATVSSGASLTYSVQVTADDVVSKDSYWNEHDVITNQTASINSNIFYPITGIRLYVSVWSSGSVNLGIAQWP